MPYALMPGKTEDTKSCMSKCPDGFTLSYTYDWLLFVCVPAQVTTKTGQLLHIHVLSSSSTLRERMTRPSKVIRLLILLDALLNLTMLCLVETLIEYWETFFDSHP